MHYSAHFGWSTGQSVVQMNTDGMNTIYFCLNCDDQVITRVRRLLDDGKAVASRTFLIDAIIMDVVLMRWAEKIKKLQATLLEYVSFGISTERELLAKNSFRKERALRMNPIVTH